MHEPATVASVLSWVLTHPWQSLGRRWNYKAAVLSSIVRGLLFFAVNSSVGRDAAIAAMMTELCFRFLTSGFYGALTQAFRRVEPAASGMLAAIVLLPMTAHSLEFVVHFWRGTPALGASIAASVLFTALSTAFNLFAMRRGALIVGAGRQSLTADLAAMPRLVVCFLTAVLTAAIRSCRRAWA